MTSYTVPVFMPITGSPVQHINQIVELYLQARCIKFFDFQIASWRFKMPGNLYNTFNCMPMNCKIYVNVNVWETEQIFYDQQVKTA